MLLFAIKMLIKDSAKYLGIVIGLSFAAFIISQQGSILLGIMKRTYGFITDTSQPDIWVVDPAVQFIDDIKPMKESDLYRVRSVEGVEWALPLFKGMIKARLSNGIFQSCILIGIDNATLIGGPPIMLEGKLQDLRIPDSVIVDRNGSRTKLASPPLPGTSIKIPLRIGDTLELNDKRAYVTGICGVSRTFQSQPVIYTTFTRATDFIPKERKLLSFIIAKARPGLDPQEVCDRIYQETRLKAYTPKGISLLNIHYYMRNTGILINFSVAITLGFIIGIAIAGQTFYNFTLDNLRYFGTLKAMGAVNKTLTQMILLQAFFLGTIGWGIGIGAAAIFGYLAKGTELSFNMPFALYLTSLFSLLGICLLSAYFSIRKVRKTDPAIVFKS
ncbi:MAG: FtsX-like permease family protein [Chlamydiales bacterium]|nr:FtsX-like permease family protein [Chlamydiales bacterium]